jgi:two-component system sensor histidine kinase GlrK
MKEFTVFERFGLGYLVIFLVVISLGMYATLKLGQLSRITRSINAIDKELIETVSRLRDNLLSQRSFEKKYIISKDKDFFRQFKEIEDYIKKGFEKTSVLASGTSEEETLSELRNLFEQYLSIVMLDSGQSSYLIETEEEKVALINQISRGLEQVVQKTEGTVNNKIETSEKIGAYASRVVAAATALAFMMAFMIAFFNAQTISRPLRLLLSGIKEIAEGRFEKQITIQSPPEIKELASAFNHMSRRLKELDEMKADIISHVSHELRTPLAIIKESVSLLASVRTPVSPEKQRRLVDIIGEECERLISTVNRILDLSRMEAGMTNYNINKTTIGSLMERSVSTVRTICAKKGVFLKVKIDDNVPPVKVDGEKICQVMNILLENAIKFTPKGGDIVLWAHCTNRKNLVEVSVTDTGCGIPEGHIEEIFKKFKSFDSRGTGLGLYMAKHIINTHGGELWVTSEVGKGSSFSFIVSAFL